VSKGEAVIEKVLPPTDQVLVQAALGHLQAGPVEVGHPVQVPGPVIQAVADPDPNDNRVKKGKMFFSSNLY
jgi:hypothetical protein